MTAKRWIVMALAAGTMTLAACQSEATGQVAAVVNGEEITLQEINAELGQVEIPEGADRQEFQRAALQRIVERRLLAQAARREGVDKTPDFLIRRRQLEDALLVQLLSQQVQRTTSVPDPGMIETFIKENPALFAQRTMFTLDRIQFRTPADPASLRALESDHSMDAVAARLRQMGIEFTRDQAQLDSAQFGQDRVNRILGLPEGEPFMFPEGGGVTVAAIIGSSPRPIGEEQARPAAVQLIRNRALSDTLRQRLEAEKATADIKYQEGFAPAATPDPADGTSPA
jgi:peptidyl-prolyl cis-trans isomerase C